MNFNYEAVEKYWKNNLIFYYIFCSYILFIIPSIPLNLSWKARLLWIVLVTIVLIIFYICIFLKRRLPKAKNGFTGILFAINFSDQKQYELVNSKFIKKFEEIISSHNIIKPQVLILNDYLTNKWNVNTLINNDIKAQELLLKTNCKILIVGSCISGGEKEEYSCFLNLKAGIIHKSLDKDSNSELCKIISIIFYPLNNIHILKSNETNVFNINAYQLKLAIEYTIATTMLMCKEFILADNLYCELSAEISCDSRNIPIVKYLKKIINKCIADTRVCLALKECESYYLNYDNKYLIKAKQILDNSKRYLDTSITANNIYSIYYFSVKRDIQSAIDHIKSKQFSSNSLIIFNLVFLKLYKNDTPTNFIRVYSVYKKLNEISINELMNLEGFINNILELEPNKIQLSFLLFLIYDFLNNHELAETQAKLFASKYKHILLNEKFKLRYEDYIYKYSKEFSLINTNDDFISQPNECKKENDLVKFIN